MKTLYSGGKLFDGEDILADHAVLTHGPRIEKVAPKAEFEGFAGEVVDTSGGTLMPGIIDCHVHICLGAEGDPGTAADKLSPAQLTLRALERAQAALAGGITAARDCGGKDFTEISVRDFIRQGIFPGPTIRASGRVICMTGGHGSRSGRVADGVEEVKKAVREQIHGGADQIKLMATGGVMTPGVNPEDAHYSAEEMAAGIHEAGRFHKRTASHAQGAEGILNAVRGGVTSIEHGIFLNEKCIAEMLERGTYLVPTLAAVRNILNHKDRGIPAWAVEKAERVQETHKQAFKRFYQAGGRIAMGTDAGTPFNAHGSNAMELEYMVEVGMTSLDSLKASTAVAAELLDLADQGRIREGNAADLLLVDGDPVADITRAARREHHRLVVKNGSPKGGITTVVGAISPPRMAAAAGTF